MFQGPWIMLCIQLVYLSQLREVCGQNGPQFVFEVMLQSYVNSDSTDSTGQCCRPSNNCDQGCRNLFNVCAQQDESSSQCNYGETSFNRDSESAMTVIFGQDLEAGVLSNPVSFSPDIGQWPGAFRVVVSVTNTERTNPDLVDRFIISRDTLTSGEMVSETIPGEFGNMLDVSIQLRCMDPFTGPNCEPAVVATTVPATTTTPSSETPDTEPPFTTLTMGAGTTDTVPPSTTLPMAATSSPGQTTTVQTATSTSAGTEDTTASSNTTSGGNPQASGLSEGGVAGLVIGILIGSVLVVIGIVVVIWWYRGRSSANFKINDPVAAKQSLENPNYVMVTMNNSAVSSSNVSPAPIYTSTQLYETVAIERSLDNDNPLYFSMEASNDDYAIPPDAMLVKQPQIDDDDYDLVPDEQGHPPLPVKPPRIDEADYDLPPGERGYPLPPSHPPPPPHNLSGSYGNQLNPYGEYGDGTIRRVASQQSVNCEVFDNPDYCEPSTLDTSS